MQLTSGARPGALRAHFIEAPLAADPSVRPTTGANHTFEALKGLFRRREVAEGPTLPGTSFAETHFFFLCLPERFASGIPTNSSPEELLAYVEEAASDLASSQAYEPFAYDEDGHRVLPLFTSEDHARQFVEAYVVKVHRIIPFQVLGVRGESLVATVRAYEEVIVNPGSSNAAVLRSRTKGAVGRHGA